MERKEFEQILKRALELQSLQKKKVEETENSYSAEDLHSAASRLGISEDILEKAISETGNKFKKFHLSASPDDVKEAFLKHFLMQESNTSQQHQPMKIDHNTIKIGSNSAIRVYHPQGKDIEAFVEFSDDGCGGTNVTWTANTKLGTTTKVLVSSWPFAFLALAVFLAVAKGAFLTPFWLIFVFCLLFSQFIIWAMQKNADRLEENLTSYFSNCQTLDELEAHKQMKKELEEFRNEKTESLNNKQKEILKKPAQELEDSDEQDDSIPDSSGDKYERE